MNYDFPAVIGRFQVDGTPEDIRPFGSGHINDTFAAVFKRNGVPVRYILQRINHYVFRQPAELMDNIERVTRHIHGRLKAEGQSEINRRVLNVIPAKEGKSFYRDAEGNYWRVFDFIENAQTYDVVPSLEGIRAGAAAFGRFQRYLSDLPAPSLYETIPNFHSGPKRFGDFKDALQKDASNRAAQAAKEIDFVLQQAAIFERMTELVRRGEIPIRVTHNDTKINNVMIDDVTGEGICVIDLDTTMPGVSLYDFGDLVRTTVSLGAEDEQDLSKIDVETDRFKAVLVGFLEGAGSFLNPVEKSNLLLGGMYITQIIGVRFLTDYLAGDQYFKIHRENHNLHRSRTQFKLVQTMLERQDELTAMIQQACRQTDGDRLAN